MTYPWDIPGISARLLELHALSGEQALTMAQIADKLSFEFEVEVSRNGVIGRCHRIGLQSRPSVPFIRRRTLPAKRIRARVEAPIEPVEAQIPLIHHGLTITQLRYGVCRWPLGEVMDRPPFIYCGKRTEEGGPYCPPHFKKAHQRGAP